jgi:hypothetical protein
MRGKNGKKSMKIWALAKLYNTCLIIPTLRVHVMPLLQAPKVRGKMARKLNK